PVAQDGEADSVLLGKGKVREGAVHAHTQYLGVGALQFGEILLESFHFAGSTTGESEDEKRQSDIFLSAVILQRYFLQLFPVEGKQSEIRSGITHLELHGRSFFLNLILRFLLCLQQRRRC